MATIIIIIPNYNNLRYEKDIPDKVAYAIFKDMTTPREPEEKIY